MKKAFPMMTLIVLLLWEITTDMKAFYTVLKRETSDWGRTREGKGAK